MRGTQAASPKEIMGPAITHERIESLSGSIHAYKYSTNGQKFQPLNAMGPDARSAI